MQNGQLFGDNGGKETNPGPAATQGGHHLEGYSGRGVSCGASTLMGQSDPNIPQPDKAFSIAIPENLIVTE